MNRVDRTLVELGCGPRTIANLMDRLGCTEGQARGSVNNLINRIMVVRVDGSRPAQYRLTARGREYMREGRVRHLWARGRIGAGVYEQRSEG